MVVLGGHLPGRSHGGPYAGVLGQAPVDAGTLHTQVVSFVTLTTGVALIVALLNFLPALSLGPLADGLLG
ncbi:hypothetical protein Pmi06nite_77640 [Planotetraspora mira]|uniref:Uncharacterized protein n=1 Tax=Planotetraspora mira TaxID=58121 RepID=A0A8J3TXY3_9ACTN|nr:hypothetical protein Pmi06nite_77640 [Planotetraspora mira]